MGTAAAGRPASGTAHLRRVAPFLAVAVFPVVEAIRIVRGPGVALYGDEALIGMAARQAASFSRLLGPYSRDGFHHPGPALFYLLAPFSGSSRSLYIGALAINLVALLGVVAVIDHRAGPRGALWTAAVLDLYLLVLGPGTLREPWNPYLVIVPMIAFVVLWAGDHRSWALVVGSYLVQTHLSTAPVVFVLLMTSVRRPVRHDAARLLRLGGWVVLVAMWVPPLIEFHNFATIWHFFAVRHSPLGVIGLALLGAAAAGVGSPRSFPARLFFAAFVTAVVGATSLLFADGPVYRYFALWLTVAPVLVGLAWAARGWVGATVPALVAALALGAVALTMKPIDRTAGAGPWPAADAAAHHLTVADTAVFDRAVLTAIAGQKRATVTFDQEGLWPYAAGVAWALDTHGVATSVPGWPLYFGDSDDPERSGARFGLFPAASPFTGTVLADVDGTVLVRLPNQVP